VGPMKAKAERGQQQVVRSFDKIGAPITKKWKASWARIEGRLRSLKKRQAINQAETVAIWKVAVQRADNITTIYEPTVLTMWHIRHLTTCRPPRG
jgi:hypothetical protein